MEIAARDENRPVEFVMDEIARGRAVIPFNPAHSNVKAVIVGNSYRTKVNANIGRSPVRSCDDEEVAKVNVALAAGADFVMDLSVGEDLGEVRRAILGGCSAPVILLNNNHVKALIVAGIGGRPLQGFRETGIEVYAGIGQTVQEAVDLFLADQLSPISNDQVCGGGPQ
jgi:hypothetical protein